MKSKYINQLEIRDINLNREQHRIALKVLSKNKINLKKKKILDFGAGNGEFSEYLISKEAGVECYEINKNSKKILKGKGLKTVNKIPKNKYDYIFSLEVIEHFVNPVEMIKLIKKALKKGGFVFISTPDHLYWKLRIKYFLGNIKAFEYPNKHFTFFTKNSLRKLLNKYFREVLIERIESKLIYIGKNGS